MYFYSSWLSSVTKASLWQEVACAQRRPHSLSLFTDLLKSHALKCFFKSTIVKALIWSSPVKVHETSEHVGSETLGGNPGRQTADMTTYLHHKKTSQHASKLMISVWFVFHENFLITVVFLKFLLSRSDKTRRSLTMRFWFFRNFVSMLHVYLCWAEKCNSFTIWIRFQTIMCVWNNSHSLFLPFNEKLFALMSRRTAKKGNKSLNKNVLDISNTLSAEFFSQFMVECVAFHQAEFLKIKGKHFPLSSFIRRYMWDLRDI